MSRQKKSRKGGQLAPSKPKESRQQRQDAQEQKRKKEHRGNKPGSRMMEEKNPNEASTSQQAVDPRTGSKKPIDLTPSKKSEPKAPKATKAKSPETVLQPAPVDETVALEAELAALQNNERLAALLDQVEQQQTIEETDLDWLELQLLRHQELLEALGLEDSLDLDDPDDDDTLWQRFDRDV